MKKYLLFTLFSAFGLLLTLNLTAFKAAEKAEEPWEYILVEVYEVPGYNDKGIHIHYGDAKTEIIPFKEFTAENHDDNGDLILKAVNDLGQKGYHIAHISSGLAQSGMITKIFMTKK